MVLLIFMVGMREKIVLMVLAEDLCLFMYKQCVECYLLYYFLGVKYTVYLS